MHKMKTVFITGSNRGIGLEIAKQCLARGNRVLASCREPDNANKLCDLKKSFPLLTIYPMDVTKEKSVSEVFARILKEGIQVDFLFNNAGIMDWSDFSHVKTDSFRKVLEVNVVGAFIVMRRCVLCLKKSESPLVINLSSRLGSIELRGNSQLGGAIAYQCSKAALNMLTKQTSLELNQEGIRVISQSPGWVKTEMGGADAKYEVTESVKLMLQSIENLKPKQTGVFIGEDGVEVPW